jgi:hypothetical protein
MQINLKDDPRIESNGINLTNVQKSGSSHDLMVVQCMGENDHGKIFAQGYINVLEKTVIKSVQVVRNDLGTAGEAQLQCVVTADELTPPQFKWLLNGKPVPSESILDQRDGILSLKVESSEASSYQGKYTCFATNGYSEDTASVQLAPPILPSASEDDTASVQLAPTLQSTSEDDTTSVQLAPTLRSASEDDLSLLLCSLTFVCILAIGLSLLRHVKKY